MAASSQPVEILGIDPVREPQVTSLHRQLTAGRYLRPEETGTVVLGSTLARKLGATVGSTVVVVTQAADGSIGNDLLTVCGIFATGNNRLDDRLALTPLPWLQQLLVLDGRIHEVTMAIADPLAAFAPGRPAQHRTAGQDPGPRLGRPPPRDARGDRLLRRQPHDRGRHPLLRHRAGDPQHLLHVGHGAHPRIRPASRLWHAPWGIRRLVLLETLFLACSAVTLGLLGGALLTWYMQAVGIDLSAVITPVTYAGGTILPRLRAVFDPANFCDSRRVADRRRPACRLPPRQPRRPPRPGGGAAGGVSQC